MFGLVVVVIIGIVLAVVLLGSPRKPTPAKAAHRPPHHVTVHPKSTAIPALESALLPWKLKAPLGREVVLPGVGNQVVVLGGLTTGDTSSSGIYTLDTSNGVLTLIGDLNVPLHDASGAVIAGNDVVFGGGGVTELATVQAFPAPTGSTAATNTPPRKATVVGALPQTRSDSSSATIGTTSYVVGGFDGTAADAVVLGTTDGHTFSAVATLPVPVRYAAVTAVDGKIYVFGGQAVTGAEAGLPIDTVQVIDPAHHSAVVAGQLPQPLRGAVAVTLAGHVYVIGGQSTSSTVSSIWSFDPTSARVAVAGRLQVPVSNAAVAVIGSTAWLVGGETNGTQVTAVQMLTPSATG